MKRIIAIVLCAFMAVACANKTTNEAGNQEAPQYEELNELAIAVQSVINIRENPDYAAEMGTQALMGTPLKLHYAPKDDYWVYVETPEGYKGWVHDMAIRRITPEELQAWKQSKRVIVTAYYTFFLQEPREGAQHVSDGCWGCIAQFAGTSGKFTKVILPDGKEAYVPSADVMDFRDWATSRKALVTANAPEKDLEKAREEILTAAKSFLGIPYLWAGTSIKGVDCSGLTKTIYFLNGYVLLRNASQQYKTGDPVDISEGLDNLKPGDLVFFGREATANRPERITHTSIYLGDGKIIHSSMVVRINSLVEGQPDYYSRKPLRACRIIGTQDCGKDVSSVAYGGAYFE